MSRMNTFFKYALWIIAFFIFSTIASNMLLQNSYKHVKEDNIQIEESDNGFEIILDRAESNKLQAFFTGTVKNNSDKVIEKQYVKVESYYKGKKMQEKYLAFENLQPGEERKFKLRYKVGNIDEFRVSYVDEIPANRTVVDKTIDKVVDFWDGIKDKGFSDIFGKAGNTASNAADGAKNVANGAKDAAGNFVDGVQNGVETGSFDGVLPGFEQVHVEGSDWQLFAAVMIILYYIPSGAIWFII